MKCNHGFRGEIDAVLRAVRDKNYFEEQVKDLQQDMNRSMNVSIQTKERLAALSKKLQQTSAHVFTVHFEWKCNCGELNTYPIHHSVFPHTKEWARERIGKRFRVILTQLPRGAGASVDLYEITQKK